MGCDYTDGIKGVGIVNGMEMEIMRALGIKDSAVYYNFVNG